MRIVTLIIVLFVGCFFLLISGGAKANTSTPLSCDCEYQKCIDITETKNEDGTINAPEITLKGKPVEIKGEHPYKGEFKATVIMLYKAVCFHGDIYTSGDGAQPQKRIYPNTTYIQFTGANYPSEESLGKYTELTGNITYGISAWHLTPILFEFINTQ